jgi:hypothetical protein
MLQELAAAVGTDLGRDGLEVSSPPQTRYSAPPTQESGMPRPAGYCGPSPLAVATTAIPSSSVANSVCIAAGKAAKSAAQ